MTNPERACRRAGRGVAWIAAVVTTALGTACTDSPATAPATPSAVAAKANASKTSRGTPTTARGKHRAGYNVVAD